jgi:hypothetical protein
MRDDEFYPATVEKREKGKVFLKCHDGFTKWTDMREHD